MNTSRMYDALHAAAGPELRAWMDAHRDKRVQETIKHARRMLADADYLLGVNAARFAQHYAASRPHMIGTGREGQQYRALMEGALILRAGKPTDPSRAATRREVERLLSVMRGEEEPALTGDRVRVFLSNFYALRPALARFAGVVPVKEKTHASQSRHPDASNEIVSGKDTIVLYPKFWTHDHDVQAFIFAHELGHWALSGPYGYTTARFIRVAAHEGIDVWDTASLPFAAGNMEEAFADAFASYSTDTDVLRRYPKWARLVETVAASGAGVPISVG